jgi:diphthamide synthase (EF-2-diphthine--ammonia ligase)
MMSDGQCCSLVSFSFSFRFLFSAQSDEYGCHPCGEGGEYETLTLDCPLFRYKIVLYGALLWRLLFSW